CRGTDCKTDAHARYDEWIALASEDQHALAAADSDDEPAFREYDGDLTGFSPRWCAESSHAYEQGNHGLNTKLLHDYFPQSLFFLTAQRAIIFIQIKRVFTALIRNLFNVPVPLLNF